jgi:thiosulfate dehydrogenase [quinone] large subunit
MDSCSCSCSCGDGSEKVEGTSRREMLAVLAAAAVVPMVMGGSARAADDAPASAPGWTKTINVADLADGSAHPVAGTPVVLTRVGKTVAALSSKCTHKGCSVKPKPGVTGLVCPCHGAKFDLSGTNTGGPRNSAPTLDPLSRFALKLDSDGTIEVDTSTKVAADAATGTLTLP